MAHRIALDVEGVLADTHAAVHAYSDMNYACPPDVWSFEEEAHFDDFMSVSHDLWADDHLAIPKCVSNLHGITRKLSEYHTVDILTHRTGVDEQMRQWLSTHGVEYRNFISTDEQKSQIGDYDIHIDDSPKVTQDVLCNTRDRQIIEPWRPYNEFINSSRYSRVVDVEEAVEVLC